MKQSAPSKPLCDKTTVGVQHFTIVEAFDGHAGQLTVHYNGAETFVRGDVDGDGRAEFVLQIDGDHSDFSGFVLDPST